MEPMEPAEARNLLAKPRQKRTLMVAAVVVVHASYLVVPHPALASPESGGAYTDATEDAMQALSMPLATDVELTGLDPDVAVRGESETSTVELPETSTGTIDVEYLEPDPPSAPTLVGSTTVELPTDSGVTGDIQGDGTVFYEETVDSTNLTVRPTEYGAQIFMTIEDSSAPTEFSYELDSPNLDHLEVVDTYPWTPPSPPEGESAGSFTEYPVIAKDSSGEELFGIPAPWAVDASGTPVPTHFEVDGTELIQVIEHTGASYDYPIVSDPNVSGGLMPLIFGGGFWVTATWSKREVRQLAGNTIVAALAISGVMCGSYLPTVALKAACATAIALFAYNFWPYFNHAAQHDCQFRLGFFSVNNEVGYSYLSCTK